jgi:hypothetical protein
MTNQSLKLKLPPHINASNNEERLDVFRDYKYKLEKIFPQIRIFAFDPDFSVEYCIKYNAPGGIIKEKWGGTENLSLYFVHLVLKLVGKENKNIEIYE